MKTTLIATPNLRRFLCALALSVPLSLRAAGPTINQQPANVVATVGDQALFIVGANGTPLNYQWTSNGVDILGANTNEYSISAVANGDSASYAVVITNSTGSITSQVALLTVVEPDIIASQPLDVPVNTCTNITLTVVTVGTDPNLSYHWYFGDDMTPVGGNSSNLVISSVEFTNAGTYTVSVSDGDSSDSASGTLTVTDPPPVVITQPVTVDLDASGNASITAAQVNNDSYDNCSITNMSVSPGSFSCTNVGPNTVTLYVTDNIGQTSQGTAIVTVQDLVPPSVENNTITVQLDTNGNYNLTANDIANITAGSFDACGIASTNIMPSSFTFCDVGSKTVTVQLTDVHGNVSTTNSTINVLAPIGSPSVVYADASYSASCGAVAFPNNGGSGPYYIGYNAFSSVQAAVNQVASGGTVNVAAGTYNESVTANEPVTLLGANQGIAGCAARNPESIINAGAGNAITIRATNVVVDGFELNGAVSVYDAGYVGSVVQNNTMNAAGAGVELTGLTTTAGSGWTLQNNCITLTTQLAGSSTPTVGIGINTVSGPQAPLIASNNISGAFYGYLLYGLNAAAPTVVQYSSISGVMQGVSVFNIDPLTLTNFSSSTFGVDGVTVSGFSGSYPALESAGNDFHAGVYALTVGPLSSATLTGVVTNVTVIGSSNISSDSSGLYFTDFSAGTGLRQQITVLNCNVSSNQNRGVFVSGSNAVSIVSESSIVDNGSNPYGTGGNFGFGLIARNGAQVTVSNCFIANPATVTSPYNVRAVEADADFGKVVPTLVVTDCSITNNGNPAGYLAGQDAGTLNASGNWWGTTSDTTITNLMLGVVDFTPYLDSGVDTDLVTPGFQGDFSALHVTMLGAQIGSTGRIQEGINLIADGSLTGGSRLLDVKAGLYTEINSAAYAGILIDRPLTMSSSSGAASTIISNTMQYMLEIGSSDVTVSGFTVTDPTYSTGGFGGDGTGIYVNPWPPANLSGVHVDNCIVHDLGERYVGIYSDSGPNLEIDHCTIYNIDGYPSSENNAGYYALYPQFYWSDEAIGILIADYGMPNATVSIHDNNIYSLFPRPYSVAVDVGNNVAAATVNQNQITLSGCAAGIILETNLVGPAVVSSNTISGATNGLMLQSPFAQTAIGNSISGAAASIYVLNSAATLKYNSASAGSGIGIRASGATAKALIEGNTLTGDSVAGIEADGGAIVDAGDCTGSDATGLGTGSGPGGSSAGANNLTGYGFDSAAPWAIENLNSVGAVLAYQNSYGAMAGNNLASLFSGNVLADQSGSLLVQYPGPLGFQCFSSVPAGATNLAQFVAQGGTVSATAVTVSYMDSVVSSNYPNNQVISRNYTLTDACGEMSTGSQAIMVDDTIPPTVTSWPPNQTLDVNGQCSVAVPDLTGEVMGAADNCGPVTITQIPLAGTLISLGTNNVTVTVTDQGGNSISNTVVLTVIDTQPAPTATYVDAAYTSLPAGSAVPWPFAGGTGTHYVGCDAFATIQGGVNRVATNGTVNVAAGTYTEEVTISQPLSLLGPNAMNNPNTSARVSEAVIEPDMSDPEIYDATAVVIVSIESSNVTVKGFTVDGYNPDLSAVFSAGFFGYTNSGSAFSGTYYTSAGDKFNAAVGIADYNGDSSIRIENNIIKNDSYSGVDLESDVNSQPTTNSFIDCNLLENMDYAAEGFGDAVILYNNYYAEIANNSFTNVAIGISPQNFSQANPGDARGQTITNNQVSASVVGIWLNLIYESASTFEIAGNTSTFALTNGSPLYSSIIDASNEWTGIKITSIQGAAGVSVTGNVITGPGTDVGYYTDGYNVWNTPTTGNVMIAGGSVSNVNFGVWVNDYDGFQSPGGSTHAAIAGVDINGASASGVYVQDDPRASTIGVLVQATVTGNTIITNSGTGVWVQGFNAAASVLNNSASISGNSVGISVDTGKALIENNDLTGNSIAAISVINNAIVDAGDCFGSDVTGLGTGSGANGSSAGNNNLSGYSFNSVAPWAIENFNTSASVLAENDNFGAVAGQNIASDIDDPNTLIEYSQAPAVITPPADTTVTCTNGVPPGATTLSEFITQGGYYSGNTAMVSFMDNPASPYPDGNNVITRTYTVNDGCNVTNCVQLIAVLNTNPPTFTVVPQNVTLDSDPGLCGKSGVTWSASAISYCGTPAMVVSTPLSGSSFSPGINTVTLVATDASGNTSTTNFTVTVIATNLPQFTVAATNETIVATNTETAMAPLPDLTTYVTATDPCGTPTYNQIPAAGTIVGLGNHGVTVWATDQYGNSNSTMAVITVIYTNAPVLTCPPPLTVTTTQDKDPYATGSPAVSDPDVPVTVSYSDNYTNLTGCDSTGFILRTWTAVDGSGNSNTCQQTITVIDTNAPFFTYVPADITTTNDLGQCGAVVNFGGAAEDLGYFQGFENTNWVANTNPPGSTLDWNSFASAIYRQSSGSNGIVSPNGVAYAVIDSTVPAVGPDFSNSGAFTFLGGLSSWQFENLYGYNGVSSPFGLGYRASLDVYINLNDPAVTQATETSGYAWDLTTSPSDTNANYLSEFVFHAAAYDSNGVVIGVGTQANDNGANRGADLRTAGPYATITNTGWYRFEWNFYSNSDAGLSVDMRVRDTNGAALFEQTITNGTAVAQVDGHPNLMWFTFLDVNQLPIADTAFKRKESVLSSPASGTQFAVGTTIVTNTAMDACNNVTNTTFTVTVNDVQPPSANVPADITQANDPGQCGAIVNFTLPAQTDNCGVASTNATPPSGSFFPVGTTLVTVAVTDIHGNSATNTFNVTVNDTEPPSANVPATIVQANDPGQCGAIVNFTLPAQTDNCGVASTNITPASGSFFPVGTTPVTVVVTDIHGNSATNSFSVVVNDTEPPAVTCPTNIVQAVDAGQDYATVNFTPGATDNCAIASIVATPPSGSPFAIGTNTVTVVATDIHANTNICSFTVQVVGLPQITQQPMSRTNNAGTTATFSVVATSPTPLGYLWQKNGSPLSDGGNISGSTSSTLVITTVSNMDVASYSVSVSNLAGAVLSSNATLTVIDPPVIVTQPVSVTNNATTTAAFAVTVGGTSPFGYQWYKDGTNQLVDGGNISGSLSNILTLTNVLAADRGEYSVVVTNPAGTTVSSNAVLGVVDPWIQTQPVNATEPLGGTATFSVSAVGTEPLTYQWQQNNVVIPDATNSSYTIGVIRDSDAGSYNVIVSSAGGSMTSSNAVLTVTHPPVFVTEPQNQTVVQGQTASFNVTMNGAPGFTYQWQFNSVSIPGATSHILTLNNVTTAQAGDYDVLVTNSDGFAISTQAVLTVIVPGAFVTQPTSVTNNAGTSATFSVTATGTALTYQWFKNDTNSLSDGGNISGSATSTLTLSNVLGGDAGAYSVTISNLAGPLSSSNATLTVIDPVITNEPGSTSVILGGPASFSVGAVGTSPAYQWRKGGIPINNATNSTYSLASVANSDGASYDVIVSTIYGSVTSTPPAVLTVLDPAVVITGPVSITRDAGTTASFAVVAGGTAPLGYQWLKNSSPLSDGGNISGSLTSNLNISTVSNADVASYSVVVTNAYGTNTSGSATLTVINPPVITNEPVSITNNAGTTATFTVGVSGTAPLSYQWYKNGTNELTNTGNVSGATSNVLTLSNVFGADRGDYSVIVTNIDGSATSTNATLSVVDPVITLQPTNITAIDGSTISFTVTAVGTQPLSYQWRQDDVDLEDGFGITGSGTATLTIADVADSDAGNYSVLITNSEGVATSVEAVLTTIPPLIVFQPTNAYVLVGQPFSFSVSVNGTQPFSYQWVLNSNNIANATNRIYSVAAASLSDAGSYYVVVSNPDGSETSATATLQVFTNASSTVTFLGRTNGNASIQLQGIPTFTYQLQAATNLLDTNWVSVETNVSPFIFIDTNKFPQRFYRGLYAP